MWPYFPAKLLTVINYTIVWKFHFFSYKYKFNLYSQFSDLPLVFLTYAFFLRIWYPIKYFLREMLTTHILTYIF